MVAHRKMYKTTFHSLFDANAGMGALPVRQQPPHFVCTELSLRSVSCFSSCPCSCYCTSCSLWIVMVTDTITAMTSFLQRLLPAKAFQLLWTSLGYPGLVVLSVSLRIITNSLPIMKFPGSVVLLMLLSSQQFHQFHLHLPLFCCCAWTCVGIGSNMYNLAKCDAC